MDVPRPRDIIKWKPFNVQNKFLLNGRNIFSLPKTVKLELKKIHNRFQRWKFQRFQLLWHTKSVSVCIYIYSLAMKKDSPFVPLIKYYLIWMLLNMKKKKKKKKCWFNCLLEPSFIIVEFNIKFPVNLRNVNFLTIRLFGRKIRLVTILILFKIIWLIL